MSTQRKRQTLTTGISQLFGLIQNRCLGTPPLRYSVHIQLNDHALISAHLPKLTKLEIFFDIFIGGDCALARVVKFCESSNAL